MPAYKDTDAKTGEVRWRYRFYYGGRRYGASTPKGSNTKRTAEKLEAKHIQKLEGNTFTGKMPTVAAFSVLFLEHQKPRTKPLTHVHQAMTVANHIVRLIGGKHLDEVDKALVDWLVTEWSKTAVGQTVNTRLGTLRRMLSLAVEWNYLPRVPRIQFLKLSEKSPRFLSDAEAALLMSHAEPQWRTMMMVALRTGLRVGELRGLQWGDIDLARRVLEVRRTDPGRRTMDATSPKGKRMRTVPLTDDAVTALLSIEADRRHTGAFVWPALLRRSGERRDRARSEKGAWTAISRAAERAGLEDVAWHTLRHTYASALVMRGVPIRHIQRWLGHASVKETEKYSHLSPDAGHDAVNALDVPLAPERLRQTGAKALAEGGPERNNSRELPGEG